MKIMGIFPLIDTKFFFCAWGSFLNMKIQFIADKHIYLCLLINLLFCKKYNFRWEIGDCQNCKQYEPNSDCF